MSRADSAIRSGGTQTSSMISEVPGARKRPIRPCSPSRTVQETSTRSGSRVKSGGLDQLVLAGGSPRRAATSLSSSPSVSAPNSTSSAAEVGGSSSHSCGAPAMFWAATISAGATISSTAVAPGLDQRGHRLGRRLDAVEVKPGDGRPGRQRDGLEDRLGDEAERPLGADQQAPEDLDAARPRRGRRRAGSRWCS